MEALRISRNQSVNGNFDPLRHNKALFQALMVMALHQNRRTFKYVFIQYQNFWIYFSLIFSTIGRNDFRQFGSRLNQQVAFQQVSIALNRSLSPVPGSVALIDVALVKEQNRGSAYFDLKPSDAQLIRPSIGEIQVK